MKATIKTSFVCFCAALSLATLTAQAAKLSAVEDIFQGTNLLRIAIQIPAEGMQELRNGRGRRGAESKPKAEATVTEVADLHERDRATERLHHVTTH